MSKRGDVRKFFRALRHVGVEVDRGHGHYVLRYDGRVVGVMGVGKCTNRAERNVRAQLRRAGVALPDDAGRRER